jgi:hypothetical protein
MHESSKEALESIPSGTQYVILHGKKIHEENPKNAGLFD